MGPEERRECTLYVPFDAPLEGLIGSSLHVERRPRRSAVRAAVDGLDGCRRFRQSEGLPVRCSSPGLVWMAPLFRRLKAVFIWMVRRLHICFCRTGALWGVAGSSCFLVTSVPFSGYAEVFNETRRNSSP
jgi:hypothetical protein